MTAPSAHEPSRATLDRRRQIWWGSIGLALGVVLLVVALVLVVRGPRLHLDVTDQSSGRTSAVTVACASPSAAPGSAVDLSPVDSDGHQDVLDSADDLGGDSSVDLDAGAALLCGQQRDRALTQAGGASLLGLVLLVGGLSGLRRRRAGRPADPAPAAAPE